MRKLAQEKYAYLLFERINPGKLSYEDYLKQEKRRKKPHKKPPMRRFEPVVIVEIN